MRIRSGKCKRTDKCVYGTIISGEYCCGYMLATDKKRGCPADKCDKFEQVKDGQRKEFDWVEEM